MVCLVPDLLLKSIHFRPALHLTTTALHLINTEFEDGVMDDKP